MANEDPQTPQNPPRLHPAAAWGIVGVLALLMSAVVRLAPRAGEPFSDGMPAWQWGLYVLFVVFMAYTEGYKGFQRAFAPRVVVRAFAIPRRRIVRILAPLYCMGLIHATRKRLWVSRILLIAIVGLVVMVRFLPYPYRSIVDAGVVVGLTWGSVAIVAFTVQALRGAPPQVPSDLPES